MLYLFQNFSKNSFSLFQLIFLFVKFKFCLVLSSNCENILAFKSTMNWGSLSFGFKQFCMDFITCITIEHATNSAPPRVMVWTSSWVYNLWTPSITIWSESVRIRLSRYFPLTVFQNSILHLLRSSKYFLDTHTNYQYTNYRDTCPYSLWAHLKKNIKHHTFKRSQ